VLKQLNIHRQKEGRDEGRKDESEGGGKEGREERRKKKNNIDFIPYVKINSNGSHTYI
jgi:hypothetical protein